MERYFVFLVVHDAENQQDCHCPKDVIPALKSLLNDLDEFCNQDKNTLKDIENSRQSVLYDPFLALKDATPTIYFSIVEYRLLHQLEVYSKWHKGEHLGEVSSVLCKPIKCYNKNADREISCEQDFEISARLHQLADDLPDHAGAPVNVFWLMCGESSMPIRSHLHLFGALKRLQQWNNANITVLCNNKFDRNSFLTSWQKGLKISVSQLNARNNAASKLINPSVVWQGSLVFSEDQAKVKLSGFSLCCERSKSDSKLHVKRRRETCTEVAKSAFSIAPEITMLCKVQKHTVPLHMFVPVKLRLNLAGSSTKLSARLVEWLSLENNKDIALIGSVKLVVPSINRLKEKSKEDWFNFVKSQSHSATIDSNTEEDDIDSHRRLCLICGGNEKELSLFVLRAPEHLNGELQHDLAMVQSSVLIANDQEAGGPLRFPDLTDNFLEMEQELTEVLLCRLQEELIDSDVPRSDSSCELVDQLISVKWKLLKEKREQLLRAGKEYELEVMRRENLLQDQPDFSMSPSRWPERAWLIKNDPNATGKDATQGGASKHFPLLTSVSALSIQDILEKFRLDGTPVAADLSPVQPREESFRDRHVQIISTGSVEDVKGENYPEALAASYHGIEYCLDNRGAIAKDSQLAFLQSSHVKLETLSSCVERDHKPVENRPARSVTKATKITDNELMKIKVPLIRTKVAAKGRKPAVLGRAPKRKSPVVKKTAAAMKRKREEPCVEEAKSSQTTDIKDKETRSERHKRRLRQVVQKTLEDHGIDSNHAFYESCTERLYSLCKSFLKDLRSSHGLNDEMKRLAKSNVQQVIEFETKRKSSAQT